MLVHLSGYIFVNLFVFQSTTVFQSATVFVFISAFTFWVCLKVFSRFVFVVGNSQSPFLRVFLNETPREV